MFGSLVPPATGVAAAAFVARAHAAVPSIAADVDPGALGARLINRITFGISAEEVTLFNSLGYTGYLEYHLNHIAIADTYVESRLTGGVSGIPALNTLSFTGEQIAAANNPSQQTNELIEAVMIRAVYSKRQLFERMVDFWSDHFSLDVNTTLVAFLKPLDDRGTIRANALGTFGAMLNASARSPAMLNYLNNDLSRATGINENYARELLELHTVSPESGYTQADVIAVARCFTGWTLYSGSANPSNLRYTFRYNAAFHDNAAKVLSPAFNLTGSTAVTIPANQPAMKDAQDVLDILARHPSTAKFIATKLCRRLLGEACPQDIIDQVKATYLDNGLGQVGDIKSMLRIILAPNVLYTSPLRLKRPFHLFMSVLRSLPITITTTGSLRTRLSRAGHLPFNWGPPDGYPDTLEYWSGLQLPRWNFPVELVPATAATGSGIGGLSVDVATLLAGTTTAAQIMDRIDQVVFRGEMDASNKSRILTYLASTAVTQQFRNEAVALSMAVPAFQWY